VKQWNFVDKKVAINAKHEQKIDTHS